MRRLAALGLAMALLLAVSGPAAAQEAPPGGRFFDDNETVHEPNIEAIAELGITSGCVPEGTAFCPGNDVTREQMATFIARALGLTPRPNVFTDVDPTSAHAGNIAAIRHAGITVGCNAAGTLFCPRDLVTREQMASFLVRAFGLTPSQIGPFEDVSGVHLPNINALAREGITLGCNASGTLFCPHNRVNRGQMASFLGRALDLEPVVLPPRLQLTGVQSICTGSTPVCSGTTGGPNADVFYIQEGWFYSLPYGSGDQTRFWQSDFRLYIDGVEVTDMSRVPATDLFGTMVTLEGYVVRDLSPGSHSIVGEWWWDGEAAFTSVVFLTVAG